jgi:hypothetical protein
MNVFQQITSGLKKLWEFISSPKVRNAVEQAASLVNIALPIVDELSTIDPKTARLKEVADAYRKYGVPMIQTYTQDPTSIGNALLNLGTQILRSNLPANKAELPTNILNTAVQLAVTALKAAKEQNGRISSSQETK